MMVTRFDRFAACALLAAFVCTTPAPAGIIMWDGEGADDRFVTALNWSGDMVPMATEGASYQIPDTIVFDATHTTLGATVTNDVVFDLPFLFGSTYFVGKPNIDTPALGVTGMLTVTGSGQLLTTDTIVESSGSTALVRVDQQVRWCDDGRTDIGRAPNTSGRLEVVDSAFVESFYAKLACCSGSTGSALIRGDCQNEMFPTWAILTVLEIGDGELSDATLDVEQCGVLEVGDLRVGSDYMTTGTLTASDGGRVRTNMTTIGGSSEAVGMVTITGTDSVWLDSGVFLVVGTGGNGTVHITSTADWLSGACILGLLPGASGTVLIDGAGSTWDNVAELTVGRQGVGAMHVKGGGVVTSTTGFIGEFAGAEGTVSIAGAGSTWAAFSEVHVGALGMGTLDITNQGTAFGTSSFVGSFPDSHGTVNVAGADSAWANLQSATIGGFGTGVLTVHTGGTVIAPSIVVGDDGTVSGDGLLDGDVVSSGSIDPGMPIGALAIVGDYEQESGGTLLVTIDATQHDRLDVADVAELGGTLQLALADGFTPSPGAEFVIVDAALILGTFSNVFGPPELDVMYTPTQVIAVGTTDCPWDLDGSGDVGITDFLALLAAWGPNPGHSADFDGDDIVGITDFLELLGAWGVCT